MRPLAYGFQSSKLLKMTGQPTVPPCTDGKIQVNLPRSKSEPIDDEILSQVCQASVALDCVAGDATQVHSQGKRHAGMSDNDFYRSIYEEEGLEEDDEMRLDSVLCDESVKKKIELLAGMVGVDSTEPSKVLGEVVTVLKELTRQARKVVMAGDPRKETQALNKTERANCGRRI